jgi:hypothetical protein
VVAQHAPFCLAYNEVQALAWISPIADDVTKTVNGLYTTAFDVRKDRRQRLDIRMYVAYQCKHKNTYLAKKT